jgi:hypothetical protein
MLGILFLGLAGKGKLIIFIDERKLSHCVFPDMECLPDTACALTSIHYFGLIGL